MQGILRTDQGTQGNGSGAPDPTSDPEEAFLLVPIEGDRALQNPVKGKLWRQGAIPDRHLESGRQEGEGRTGPDESVVVPGLACDLGKVRSGLQRREPAMRIGKCAEQHRIRFGSNCACHQFRLDAAAADTNWCREGAEIGREFIRWHV